MQQIICKHTYFDMFAENFIFTFWYRQKKKCYDKDSHWYVREHLFLIYFLLLIF